MNNTPTPPEDMSINEKQAWKEGYQAGWLDMPFIPHVPTPYDDYMSFSFWGRIKYRIVWYVMWYSGGKEEMSPHKPWRPGKRP